MARSVQFEGKLHQFPDDATDAEIAAALSPAPAPEPVEALNSRSESVPRTALTQITQAPDFWQGIKAAGRYAGEKGAELVDATGIGRWLQGFQPEAPGGYSKEPSAGVTETRQIGQLLGEMVTPDPVSIAAGGFGAGKVVSGVRKIVEEGAGAGLGQAGKILARGKAGVSGDLIDRVPTQGTAGMTRRGLEAPGTDGGMRAPGDPLIEADRNALGRRLSSGATVRPYQEGGVIVKADPAPKRVPEPNAAPTGRPGQIVDPFAKEADRDIPGVPVTGARKGPTMGATPLPSGELKTAKEIVGEAGSRRVRATSVAAADVQPSIVASQPAGLIDPATIMDETALRLTQVRGHNVRDPRLDGIQEALDVPMVVDSKKAAAFRGAMGALLGGAGPAAADEGEDDDVISRRVVYALLGAGLGVASYPLARRVLAAWRGRPIPHVPMPTQPASVAGKGVVGGDLKSAAEIAMKTYGSIPRPKANPIIEGALQTAAQTVPLPPAAQLIPILDNAMGQKVAKFTEALFVNTKFKYVPGDVALSDQMLDILRYGYASPAEINTALQAAGMSHAELLVTLGLERGSLSEAARKMANWSVAARNIQKALREDTAARTPLSLLDRVRWSAHDFMYNVMALWRGALTSQIATGLRNAYVSIGRGGMQTADSIFDAAIRAATGKTAVSPIEGLEMWGRAFRYSNTRKIAEEVLRTKPSQWRKLYGDILEANEAARNSNVGQAVGIMNWHNALQEKFFRNIAFTTALDRELTMRGMDLTQMVKNGQMGQVPLDAMKKAVDEGLAFTFAQSPDFGTNWWHANKLMHQWWMVPLTPFPRFMYNTYKFYMEYSPLGLIDIARRNGGTTRDWAKQLTGLGVLGAAYMFRSSNLAGEKWYQVKAGDKTIDLRPFNPLAGFVFMAEFLRRFVQGERNMGGRELLEGFVGLNMRAGTGFAFFDQFVDSLSTYGWNDEWEWKKLSTGAQEVAGEWIGGFATPLQQLQDLVDGFLEEPYKMERKGDPLKDPFKARLPYRMLPPAVNPLTQATPMRHATIARLLGVSVEGPRTAAEKEYQRMDMTPGQIVHRTGINEWDRHMAGYMAMMVDAVVDPFVQTPAYQNLSYAQQALALRQITSATREIAAYFAINANPVLAGEAQMQEMPKLERRVLTELFGAEVVTNPGSVEVVRFMRSNLPDYAAFLKDLSKSIQQK